MSERDPNFDVDPAEDDSADGALPAAIVARLERADRALSVVAPRTDEAVLAAARAQFAARPARAAVRRSRWAVPFAAAAAAILAAVLVLRPFDAPRSADDVDGSGRVDILDAFALARLRVAQGDSAVSQERIDRLAERVVALAPPERAR
ncbi:MAG TPA: hypothetical protein VFO94_03200 [Gammaproteobacteria bacterium]|nr:hypothetical protein [Gammaproteobacteria bacterium]